METSAIGWPPWLITFWYLLISEQLYMLMHEAMTWFLQIQRYQNGINQGGHPNALVSMATTLSETRLYSPFDTKNYWKEKKWLCVRLRSGDKHHLRKSSDRKAQISPVRVTNAFLICVFRSEDFLRWCNVDHPRKSSQLLNLLNLINSFSISNSSWYYLIPPPRFLYKAEHCKG